MRTSSSTTSGATRPASSMPVGTVTSLAHDVEPGLGVHQHRQTAPEQLLVVDDDDPDRLRLPVQG